MNQTTINCFCIFCCSDECFNWKRECVLEWSAAFELLSKHRRAQILHLDNNKPNREFIMNDVYPTWFWSDVSMKEWTYHYTILNTRGNFCSKVLHIVHYNLFVFHNSVTGVSLFGDSCLTTMYCAMPGTCTDLKGRISNRYMRSARNARTFVLIAACRNNMSSRQTR